MEHGRRIRLLGDVELRHGDTQLSLESARQVAARLPDRAPRGADRAEARGDLAEAMPTPTAC